MPNTQTLGMPLGNLEDEDDDLLSLDLDDNTDVMISKQNNPMRNISGKDDEVISTFVDNRPVANNDDEDEKLQQLFANNDEDEEDQFIASQSIFVSSTHFNNEKQSPPKILREKSQFIQPNAPNGRSQNPPMTTKDKENLSTTLQNKSSLKDDSKKIPDQTTKRPLTAKLNEITMLEVLADNKTWAYTLNDMKNRFRYVGLEASLLKMYSLNYYYKKFFEYDLLMKSDDSGVRKLPMLCVWVKELTRKPTSATLLLTDFSENIKGTVMKSFLKTKSNWNYLMIGSVLFIKDVYLLKVNNNKNCYHLNINQNNIVSIYYPLLEEDSIGKIDRFDVQPFDSSSIKKHIDQFENSYTNYEYKSPVKNDSTLNKSNGSKKSNNNIKSAPYQIPAHLNRTNNQRIGSVKTVSKSNQYSGNSSSAIQHSNANASHRPIGNVSKLSVANISEFTSSIGLNNLEGDDINDEDLLFLADNHERHSTQKQTQNPALSEDMFSQLIFGCEDQLLNDDD